MKISQNGHGYPNNVVPEDDTAAKETQFPKIAEVDVDDLNFKKELSERCPENGQTAKCQKWPVDCNW